MEPNTIYTLNVLRTARQKFKNKVDLKLGANAFENLIIIKRNSIFKNFVHSVSFFTIFVQYWTPEQIIIYKKSEKKLTNNFEKSIDTTGSLLKKIKSDRRYVSYFYLLHSDLS